MKENKGISLIVLVITIIVMIILAGAIILSLNNAGIIGKANQAVDLANEATVKQLADLKWSEAYMEGKRNPADLEERVVNGLVDSGVDINDYMITATANGVVVEKVESEYSYYSTIEKAIADANVGTIGNNADATKEAAEAVVYTHNNNVYVSLLQDVTIEDMLYIYKDMTLNLGGHKLSLVSSSNTEVALDVGSDGTKRIATKFNINGNVEGSKIIVEASEAERAVGVLILPDSTAHIIGGEYIVTSDGSANTYGVSINSNASATVTNCIIKVEDLDKGTTLGIGSWGKSDISNCTISSKSSGMAVGVYNTSGRMTINNCEITATQAAIQNTSGEIIVNGGIYKGHSCGALTYGKLYMQNATIKSMELDGNYTYNEENYYKPTGRGIVIGGASNAEVYVNNCNFETSENSIVLGKLYNEKNNNIYISNSKINTNKEILIQDASHRVHIGTGCNFTAANTSLPENVENTDAVYVAP